MTNEAQEACDAVRAALDAAVDKLGSLDYRDVLDELEGDIKSRLDCWHEENPESE